MCVDSRSLGPRTCLPYGRRCRWLRCPANSHHARHCLPLLLFQLPLCPQPAASTSQTRVCCSYESQGCSSSNEGVCLCFVYIVQILNWKSPIILCFAKFVFCFKLFYTAASFNCSSLLLLRGCSAKAFVIHHGQTAVDHYRQFVADCGLYIWRDKRRLRSGHSLRVLYMFSTNL